MTIKNWTTIIYVQNNDFQRIGHFSKNDSYYLEIYALLPCTIESEQKWKVILSTKRRIWCKIHAQKVGRTISQFETDILIAEGD